MHKHRIFDGHNDLLSRMLRLKTAGEPINFIRGSGGHIDLAKAQTGALVGGFFAVFVAPSSEFGTPLGAMMKTPYDIPLPDPIPQNAAASSAWAQVSLLQDMQDRCALNICTSVAEIEISIENRRLAAILHMEGAEAIDPDLENLDAFYDAGLRSLGPVWSRSNIFGEGVPFRFPSSPDTGGGLSDAGKSLVAACNKKGIMIDVSHLTQRGFWDVVNVTDAPIVATHSNAHHLSPHSRNLTDDQLHAIAQTNGVVGLNFATAMLRDDGRMIDDVPIDTLLAHLDYLLSILGEDGVAIGSDFDGAVIPACIQDASGLQVLCEAMIQAGFGSTLVDKICSENWLGLLGRTWKK